MRMKKIKITREEMAMMSEGMRNPKPDVEAKAAFGCLIIAAVCLICAIGVFALVAAINSMR